MALSASPARVHSAPRLNHAACRWRPPTCSAIQVRYSSMTRPWPRVAPICSTMLSRSANDADSNRDSRVGSGLARDWLIGRPSSAARPRIQRQQDEYSVNRGVEFADFRAPSRWLSWRFDRGRFRGLVVPWRAGMLYPGTVAFAGVRPMTYLVA